MNNKIELARTLARRFHTLETWIHVERVVKEVSQDAEYVDASLDPEYVSRGEHFLERSGAEMQNGVLAHSRFMERRSRVRYRARLVAYLHDLVEDTPVTLDTIENLFGRTVREAVDGVTRRTSETYAEYIRRTMTNPISYAVKIADVRDHLHHLDTLPSASLLPRYKRAWKTLHEKLGVKSIY